MFQLYTITVSVTLPQGGLLNLSAISNFATDTYLISIYLLVGWFVFLFFSIESFHLDLKLYLTFSSGKKESFLKTQTHIWHKIKTNIKFWLKTPYSQSFPEANVIASYFHIFLENSLHLMSLYYSAFW